MHTHSEKTQESNIEAVSNGLQKLQGEGLPRFSIVDKRLGSAVQQDLHGLMNIHPGHQQSNTHQDRANKSMRVRQLKVYQAIANNSALSQSTQSKERGANERHAAGMAPIQRQENRSGLPVHLKTGIESLSGMRMDHVNVFYNSPQPAQLNAFAYAQGNDIHVASGQEKHLPHEAWHVVQQAQGRVKPTLQMKVGIPVNDDAGLEREADVMGAKAFDLGQRVAQVPLQPRLEPVQRVATEPQQAFPASKNVSQLVVQRVITDKNPIDTDDAQWTKVQADSYIVNKELVDASWGEEDAGPFVKGEDFVKEIIVDEVLKHAKQPGNANAEQIAASSKVRFKETIKVLKNISSEFSEAEPNAAQGNAIGERDDVVEAWEKLILDRTRVLKADDSQAAVTEIKGMIRFAQNFNIAAYKLNTIQQMSFVLKDHPEKQQFYPDFAYVLGSSFVPEPSKEVGASKLNAMVNLNTHGFAPADEDGKAYILRLMIELEPLIRGLDLKDLDKLSKDLRLMLCKVQAEILAKDINLDNWEVAIVGKLLPYKAAIKKVLDVDTAAYLARTRIEESGISIEELRLVAKHAQAQDIAGVGRPEDVSRAQIADIKEKSAVNPVGISGSIAAERVGVKKELYGNVLALCLREVPLTTLEVSGMEAKGAGYANAFNYLHYFITGALAKDATDESLIQLRQQTITKLGAQNQAEALFQEKAGAWFSPQEDIDTFDEIIRKIQAMNFDVPSSVAFSEAPQAASATPLAFTPALINSLAKASTGVDVSQGYLNAVLQNDDVAKNIKLALFLRFLPKDRLMLEMKTFMAQHPDDLPNLNNKLFKLLEVNLNAGGGIDSLAGHATRAMLEASSLQVDTVHWAANADAVREHIGGDHALAQLPAEVSTLLELAEINVGVHAYVLGRTVVVPKDNKGIGIKLLKEGETAADFNKELGMQKFLAAKKEEFGLKSDYPTALGTTSLSEQNFAKLSTLISAGIDASKGAAEHRGEPHVKDIKLAGDAIPAPEEAPELTASKRTVMLYEAPWSYFVYENRAGLTQVPNLPEMNQATKAGREKFFADALKLLKEGVGFPQLIDLNHNSDRIYNWMIDVIRMYGGALQGMGRIDNWRSAARYPNVRASGLADVGDSAPLTEMEYVHDQVQGGRPFQVNEAESAHGKVWTSMQAQKHKMLIAQYFGSYMLSTLLAEAHGFFVTEQNSMVGLAPKSKEVVLTKKDDLKARLKHTLQFGYTTFVKTFDDQVGDIDATKVITDKDVEQLADEMIFFMGGEFMATLKTSTLEDPTLADYQPKAEVTLAYENRLKELFGGDVQVKPLDALPNQVGMDASYKQALGAHGTYVAKLQNVAVSQNSLQADRESGHDRDVDLGFVNGPMPIAKLHELVHKIVALGVVSVSS